jgi:hypothetical protein
MSAKSEENWTVEDAINRIIVKCLDTLDGSTEDEQSEFWTELMNKAKIHLDLVGDDNGKQ